MKDASTLAGNFGMAIAFLAPGVVGLWGLSQYSPEIQAWFGATSSTQPTGAGFLFVALASLAAGVFISGLRQLILDGWVFRKACWPLFGRKTWLAQRIRLVSPKLDYVRLENEGTLRAYDRAVEGNYRYYQFYSNMAFAVLLAYVAWNNKRGLWPRERPAIFVISLLALIVLLLSARSSIKKFNEKVTETLGARKEDANGQRSQQASQEVGGQEEVASKEEDVEEVDVEAQEVAVTPEG